MCTLEGGDLESEGARLTPAVAVGWVLLGKEVAGPEEVRSRGVRCEGASAMVCGAPSPSACQNGM